jgi:hypothetical protein
MIIESNYFKYILLNPCQVFEPIVMGSRSVILAGGTLSPVTDLLSQVGDFIHKVDAISSTQ